MIPLIGQACAIGDQRPFVSALVVLDPDFAPRWAADQGIEYSSMNDLAANPALVTEVEAALSVAMEGFSHTEKVKKLAILGDEWLPDSDMLTPTSKLKRRGVHRAFAEIIEDLYS